MLKIIKRLDKENISLKETYKNNCKSYSLCKVFLSGFQKEIKSQREKISELKLTNDRLIAELRRLFKEKEDYIEEEKLEVNENEIDVNICEDAFHNIEAIISKGLFICLCFQ